MPIVRKPELDRMVAFELGLPLPTVRKITHAFLEHMAYALATQGAVDLHRFATIRVNVLRAPSKHSKSSDGKLNKIFVRLTKKYSFKNLLKHHYPQENGNG